MLGKLMKNEWRTTWRIITLMNLFVIIITLLASVFLYLKLWTFDPNNIFAVLCLIFYYLGIMFVSTAVCIYIAYRFYKNIYSDEGYLMHTLPVTKHQLLVSKIAVASIQLLLTMLVIITSLLSLSYSAYHTLGTDDMSKVSHEFYNVLLPQLQLSGDTMSFPISFAVYMVLTFIAGSISSVLMSYCAISLGQLFSKHKLMSSILCYLGIYIVMQTVTTIALLPAFAVNTLKGSSFSGIFSGFFAITLVITVVFTVIFYILSYYIMNKKLNLD